MAYNALNNLIDAYIYPNGVQAITGSILNNVLKTMVSQLGGGYNLMGVAAPASSPAVNDEPQAYFAATAGTYTNFDGIVLAAGEVAVLLTSGNGSWSKQTIYNVPTDTADLANTAGFITNAVNDLVNYYTKTEMDVSLANRYTKSETDTKFGDYYRKTETYDRGEIDSLFAALNRQSYIVAWDGSTAPVIADIPAGVVVSYGGSTYTGTLSASAATLNNIYLVWNGVAYDMYATSQDGGYSWVSMGTTSVDLSQYATADDLNALGGEVEKLEQGETKDPVYLSLVGINTYMNLSGVIGTLNGYDLYEIKGLRGGDILILRENNGDPVLATGLGILYVCQGILEDDTYISLVGYLKEGGAEADSSPVFVIPMPDNIKSVYFTKKQTDAKDLSFIKVGGEMIRGSIESNFPASVADVKPQNIFDAYTGLVYPRPGGIFRNLSGYNFAYAKLRKGDKVLFENIDLTALSTAGWVFTFSGGSVSSSTIGMVADYTAVSDCYLCVANKATNTTPVASLLTNEFQAGIGRVLSQTDPAKDYRFVGCVLRNVGGVWQQIGGAHQSLNVASISQDSTYIRVNYNFTAENVVSLIAAPDEDFATIGYMVGASVGLQYSDIRISQHLTLSGYVRKNGAIWDVYDDAVSVVVSGNSIKVYHASMSGFGFTFNIRNGSFIANAGAVGTDNFEVLLYNLDGTAATVIPDQFGIYFTRSFHGNIKPEDANTGGNIWVLGIMEV